MGQFLQQLINGLSLGSIYALVALGYTMVYGIIKLINFAHGDVYMIGAYTAFLVTTYLGMSFLPALLTCMIVCGILGVLVERIAYKPLRGAPRITALITAIGVSYVIEYTTQLVMGTTTRTYPQLLPNTSWQLGPVRISYLQMVIFTVTIVLMILLTLVIQKTKIGRAMRAVSADEDAARLMGISVDNTISFTFLIGSALAGAAGMLVGLYYNAATPLMGMVPGLKAFVAAVFGGIGSIPGALVGGLFIGIAESLVVAYGSSLYRDAIVYAVLIIVLIVKPTGLFGKNEREKV